MCLSQCVLAWSSASASGVSLDPDLPIAVIAGEDKMLQGNGEGPNPAGGTNPGLTSILATFVRNVI